MRAGEGQLSMLAPENARASRNQGRLEPYCKTHSRRTEHTISLWYSPLASCDPGEQDQRAHWSTLTTGRIKTLERGVRYYRYKGNSQQERRFPVGNKKRCPTRRVREGVCPSTNIWHALLLCPLFASIVSTVRTRPCRNRVLQGRTRGRGSAIR